MFVRDRSAIARHAFTIVAIGVATLLRHSLIPLLGTESPFIVYYPAIVFCAWFGGLWQGLLATALSALGAEYLFFPPYYSFRLPTWASAAHLSVFLPAGALISLLAETLHRARATAEDSEAKERARREEFRVTLNSIGDGVIVTDTAGRVTFVNEVAESLVGWSFTEATGKPLQEIFRIVNEETRVPVNNPALRAIKEGVIVGLANHTILISKDQSEIPIDDSGAPVRSADGQISGSVLVFRDISGRRKAERERGLLAGIVESSEDAIISKNLKGIIETWNAGAERLFEYSANEAIGQPITMLIPPEKLDEENLILERIRQGKRIEHYETVRASKSGKRLEISISVSPIRDSEGTIIGASKIARDISERKQAEATLRQQREWFRVTLSSIGDAVIATDTDGAITFMNPVAQSLTGWTPEEAEGRPLEEVFKIFNEETGELVENPAKRAIQEGIIVGLVNHTILRAKDGSEVPIDDSGAPIKDSDGRTLGAVLIFRDITERKFADERFRLVVEAAPNAMVMTDGRGRIVFVNSQTEHLFGFDRKELIGQSIDILVPERFRREHPEYRAGFARVPQARAMGAGRDLFGLRKDGSEVPVEIGLNPLEHKGKTMVLSSILDISARKQAEQERAQLLASEHAARERAEAANRAKDEFVAMISHEIRSPLNATLGWAQMLRTGKLDEAGASRAIETIERNARAQVQIVEDLMDISRVITGKLNLDVRPVEPSQIINAAIDSMRLAAEAKEIQLQVQLNAGGALLSGDPNRLQQIVWNLLSNAVKFTPKQGRIEIGIESKNQQLQISVQDTGIGIDPEFLPFVFDRFSQASTGSGRKHGGLGLGLAIVRHLVELHGGSVQADSAGEGTGATFTVLLPIAATREEADKFEKALDPIISLSGKDLLEGLRVMIVDDESETRELLTAILTGRGAIVKACASVAEALETLERWQPHLLVSDIGMPQEDGYSLIRKIRAVGPDRGGNIPAVALTAYARSDDRLRALAAGFQMHIPKPVEAVELVMVLASLAGRITKV